MSAQQLEERDREILAAVVQMYIQGGSPVPSSEVARRRGRVSSATVRNVMVGLEQKGYLHQPHTSAGRVPTAKAYKLYARQVASGARLRSSHRNRIDHLMAGETGGAEELLARAPHALSELCHGVGLVLLPSLAQTVLEEVRFVPLADRRVLAVVVTKAGFVRDKVVRTRQRFKRDELARMTAYLNDNFRGWTLEAIRAEMERRVAAERSRFLQQALALCQESFDAAPKDAVVHVEGMAHLLEQAEAAEPEALRDLLQALERKERLARLLADCVESSEPEPRILVGLEALSPAMKNFTLIGTCYGHQQRPMGMLGLLGPTRMDYARAITAVRYVAALLDRVLTQN